MGNVDEIDSLSEDSLYQQVLLMHEMTNYCSDIQEENSTNAGYKGAEDF